ncbi:hypothetical protein N7G274_010548 [Stereocaulon virgatum]|uniref:Cytochrome P450 n=1 Tax=Stereocaulon virgatum TaxID=373712 RepID=A0ABR3ZX91_9LECA
MALSTEIQRKAFQHPGSFALYSIALCLAFLVLRAIYNIYLHPLSSFPGPKFAVASNIPYVVAQVRGKLPHWLSALHQTYASTIVRISPNELSFIDGEAWKDIYSYRSGHKPFEKDLLIYGKPPNGVHSLLTAPKEDHTRMRRVIDHAFSAKASREQEPIVTGYVDNLIQRLHGQISGPSQGQVDLVKWYNWMTFDIIGDLSFGQSFACLETQMYHPWVETIFGNLKGITFMGACNRFTILQHILPFLIPKRIKQMIQDHWAATTANVDRRLKHGTDRPDFMSPIMKHNHDEKASLRHEELMSNASLFIIAGSESVATNLSGTTYYLLQNPDIMRKLRKEVDSAFTSEDQITAQSVANLPYLQACLSETHRIYPVALTGQAMTVPVAGDTICNIWVPGGVSFSCYTLRDIL